MAEIVRVVRVLEYVGEREWIEQTLSKGLFEGIRGEERFFHTGKGTIKEVSVSAPELMKENDNG